MTVNTPYRILQRLVKLSGDDEQVFMFALYLIELSLIEVKMYKWSYQQLTTAALYIAKKILKRPPTWSSFMATQTGLTEEEVRQCSMDIAIIMKEGKSQAYEAVNRKFSLAKYLEVAKINTESP